VSLSLAEVRDLIDGVIAGLGVAAGPSIVPDDLTTGKVYEAWALCHVVTRLTQDEGYDAVLERSSRIKLKSSPGPINPNFPCFRLTHPTRPTLQVWTDVEVMAMSWSIRPPSPPSRGDFHELDIVVVPAGETGRPKHDRMLLGVECKNTGYTKDLLRSILGVRRELSLLAEQTPTKFGHWPASHVPANPASCLLVCSTDDRVVEFSGPGEIFGIDFLHLPLP
jgi:hypothetical protein